MSELKHFSLNYFTFSCLSDRLQTGNPREERFFYGRGLNQVIVNESSWVLCSLTHMLHLFTKTNERNRTKNCAEFKRLLCVFTFNCTTMSTGNPFKWNLQITNTFKRVTREILMMLTCTLMCSHVRAFVCVWVCVCISPTAATHLCLQATKGHTHTHTNHVSRSLKNFTVFWMAVGLPSFGWVTCRHLGSQTDGTFKYLHLG